MRVLNTEPQHPTATDTDAVAAPTPLAARTAFVRFATGDWSHVPKTGSSGVTAGKKDAEGTTYSLWTNDRVGQLIMCTSPSVAVQDVRRSTAECVVFPEGTNGQTSWVSVKHARDVIRLLLLAHVRIAAVFQRRQRFFV